MLLADLSPSAALREIPGAKTYYVHQLRVGQSPVKDGGTGNDISAITYTKATVELADAGSATVDIGKVVCELSPANITTLQNILTASSNCAKNAP